MLTPNLDAVVIDTNAQELRTSAKSIKQCNVFNKVITLKNPVDAISYDEDEEYKLSVRFIVKSS